jgi:nitrite reductase/ring-hydroxylating ferredoxin subunit
MENNCVGACESETHNHKQLSRKALLGGFAALLTGVGLANFGNAAAEAATSYKVAKTSAIAQKSAKVFTVNGVSILITQPKSGVFRAFRNKCTHEPKRLPSQKISGGAITCYEHGQQYNADTGATTGSANQTNRALTKYSTKVKSGYVYVTI